MLSAARAASSRTWVSPAARGLSGFCYGSCISGHFLHIASGPILVLVKTDSKALTGGTKSWGWAGEG